MISRIRKWFKRFNNLEFFYEPIEFEGEVQIMEIPDIKYGFFGHSRKRKGKQQKGLGVVDKSGKVGYGIPLIVKEKDANPEAIEKRQNLGVLVEYAARGNKIYVRGNVRERRELTKFMLPPFDGPFGGLGKLHMPLYKGTIEMGGIPLYRFYIDWLKPFRDHILQKIE